MDSITVVPLSSEYRGQVEGWATASAVRTLLKSPEISLASDSNNQSWVAVVDGQAIGLGTISIDHKHVGYLDFMVKPSERRKGIGAALVNVILDSDFAKSLSHLNASVDHDNTAGQKILTRHGFSRIGINENGQLEFARH